MGTLIADAVEETATTQESPLFLGWRSILPAWNLMVEEIAEWERKDRDRAAGKAVAA